MHSDIENFCVLDNTSIKDAIKRMNDSRMGIVLVVDDSGCLVGAITDGDIRRSILARIQIEASVKRILESKNGTEYAVPISAKSGQGKSKYLEILKSSRLSHLPIVDEKNRVVGLVTSDELLIESLSSLSAVVMAGGRGTRLMPLTQDLPKPMLPVGNKPILEIIIEQLKSVGIQQVNVTTHHLPEKIRDHFGNGEKFGINISYVAEDRPLGTAGALGLLKESSSALLVINGDILTQIDYRAMLQFHNDHGADLTIGVRLYDFQVPYGVVESDGVSVSGIQEKPNVNLTVNAGIYLLEPRVHKHIPPDEFFNMTDLIQALIKDGGKVIGFPIHEYWLDIGEHSEYQRAQEVGVLFANGEGRDAK